MREERAADLAQIQREVNFEIGEVRRLFGVTVAPTTRLWLGIIAFGVGLLLQTLEPDLAAEHHRLCDFSRARKFRPRVLDAEKPDLGTS